MITEPNNHRGEFQWKKRGFTLIEMNIALLILVLAAAFIVPSVLAFQRSRAVKDLEASVIRFPVQARNEAIQSQVPIVVQIQNNALVMEQNPTNGTPQIEEQLDLTNDMQVTGAQQNGQSTDPGSWKWNVYPDGSSDTGGLQFSEGSQTKSLIFSSNGTVQWISGELPDPTMQKWTAGQLMQRTQ